MDTFKSRPEVSKPYFLSSTNHFAKANQAPISSIERDPLDSLPKTPPPALPQRPQPPHRSKRKSSEITYLEAQNPYQHTSMTVEAEMHL